MKYYLRFLPALLWMALIFYLSSLPHLELTGRYSIYDASLRKLAHLTEFSILCFLWFQALNSSPKNRQNPLLKAAAISFLYALSDEWHQSLVPSRRAELSDLIFDTLGIGLTIVVIYIRQRYPHRFFNP